MSKEEQKVVDIKGLGKVTLVKLGYRDYVDKLFSKDGTDSMFIFKVFIIDPEPTDEWLDKMDLSEGSKLQQEINDFCGIADFRQALSVVQKETTSGKSQRGSSEKQDGA